MPEILIIRESSSENSGVTLSIYVDGSEVVRLDHGKSKAINISSGNHAIQARYDQWVGSPLSRFGTVHIKGHSDALNVHIGSDPLTLRCGFRGGFFSLFSSGLFLQPE